MARYTSNQLNRLADRLRDDGEPNIQEIINLVGDCQHLTVDLINMTEERDTLAAELVALRAGLPRWQRFGNGHRLIASPTGIAPLALGFAWQSEGTWLADVFAGRSPTLTRNSGESAMLAVTEALGLPPCEVEGE